jgi:UDP-glucose 4-epimerase
VEDVARANLLAWQKEYVGPLNVGTGVETDINRLYTLLAEAAGAPRPAQYAPGKPGEQRRSCVDNARAREVLGWEPSVPLAEGLRRTVEYFRHLPAR